MQPKGSGAWTAVVALASLRVTFFALVLLAAAIGLAYDSVGSWSLALVPPLALLALNLIAAIATNAKLRVSAPLLLFHLALLAIVVLAAFGRLSALNGRVELIAGEEFAGLTKVEYRGPWHRGELSSVWFRNEGFVTFYDAGRQRDHTENTLRWRDESGREQIGSFNEYRPLYIHGYRFVPTGNQGFSALFEWRPTVGEPIVGGANLASFAANLDAQYREFQPPGLKTPLFVHLVLEEDIAPADRAFEFRVPDRHHLAIRNGEARWVLRSGEVLNLAEGQLRYLGLSTWLGYQVYYDRTLYWMLAASLLAIFAMAVHFVRKYFARPWDQ